jgi:hypothetical protein
MCERVDGMFVRLFEMKFQPHKLGVRIYPKKKKTQSKVKDGIRKAIELELSIITAVTVLLRRKRVEPKKFNPGLKSSKVFIWNNFVTKRVIWSV